MTSPTKRPATYADIDALPPRASLSSRGLPPGPMVQRADTSTIPRGTISDCPIALQRFEPWVPGTRPGMTAVGWGGAAIR
jgi:hypothetical protein